MTSIGYVRALRARWFPLVAITLVVTCLAVLAPPAPRAFYKPSTNLADAASEAHTRYRATTILGIPPAAGNAESQLKSISFYLRSSELQAAFAEEIGYTGTDRGLLNRIVTIGVVPAQASINVSGFGGTREQALQISNGFITALEDYLEGIKADAAAKALTTAQGTVDGLRAQIEALATQIQTQRAADVAAAQADPEFDPDSSVPASPQLQLLEAQRDSLSGAYFSAFQNLTKLSNAADTPVSAQLTVLSPATAAGAAEIPPSLIYRLPIRIGLGLLVGLLLGAAVALLLEHFSRKVSSRDAAERAFRARVIAEVPKRRVTGTLKDVAIVSAPASSAAAAYRMLRAVLVADRSAMDYSLATGRMVSPAGAGSGTAFHAPALPAGRALGPGTAAGQREVTHRTVALEEHGSARLGTSDGYSGRTNGSSVVVGSGRAALPDDSGLHPGSDPQPGAVFVLVAPADEPVLPVVVANLAASFAEVGSDVIVLRLGATGHVGEEPGDASGHDVWARETAVAGVQSVEWQPGPDTASAVDVVEALRAEGSVVLVDAGRAATAEFAEVAPIADGIVAVCEYGATRIDDADRSADIIAWSRGTFRGVVLTQVPSSRQWFRRGPRNTGSPLNL